MSTPTMYDLVRARTDDPSCGLRAGDERWTWAQVVAEADRRARWLASLGTDGKPVAHVGVLMDNLPEYVLLLCAAATSGTVLVGLNPTRRGEHLARDVEHTDCDLVVTDVGHQDLYRASGATTPVVTVGTPDYDDLLDRSDGGPLQHPGAAVEDPSRPYVLILTSGTTSAPKAVVCSSGKIASQGSVVPHLVGLTAEDTTYLVMPLFHSNAVIAGFAPTLATGATIALAPRFSASAFLDDVRRYGATYSNYVGTPLSYVLAQPERPDDGDNPLRVVFGNEAAPADIARFADRFECRVIDAYGSTEGGISILRTDETPEEALGIGIGDVAVLDANGHECPRARFADDGRLLNADEAIGELVNRDGAGAFEGYWNNDEAVHERIVDGQYHSGDLGYRDEDGFLYFAGRVGDWLRVGGENFAVAPLQRLLTSHPAVIEAAVIGVPDATAGDQVLAVLVTAEGLDVRGFTTWMSEHPSLPPRWRPRYLRLVDELPRTGTGKVRRRDLQQQAWHPADTMVATDDGYRLLDDEDRRGLRAAFDEAGRARLYPELG